MKKQVRNDDDFDKESEASDVSAYTDMKVFNGAINKIMKYNRAHEEKRPSIKNNNDRSKQTNPLNDKTQKDKYGNKTLKSAHNINIKVEEKENGKNKINEENQQGINKRMNSPLSFRTNIIDEIEKVVVNKEGIIEIQEELSMDESDYDKTSKHSDQSKNSNQSKKDKGNNYKKSKKRPSTKNSFEEGTENKNISPYNKNKDKKEPIQIHESLLKKILSSSEEESDAMKIPNDSGLEDSNRKENNIFWNLKETSITEDNELQLNSKSYNHSDRINSFNSKFNIKSPTTSQISCTISKIERGVAILVSSDDYIFTLPACLLPKNFAAGNTYQMTIDETGKAQKKLNSIQQIHKKYIKNNK